MGEYVPAADEVGRLQRGDDRECRFFKGFMNKGHYAGRTQPTSTRQGMYAVTPAGDLLASINTRRSEDMVRMLEKALAAWNKLESEARLGAEYEAEPDARFERFYPTDGLVLRCTARDLEPAEHLEEGDWRRQAWNQDFAWFRKSEVETMLPEAKVGATRDMPRELVERLACLHLVDFVRGQTPAFRPSHIKVAELALEVTDVQGDTLQLVLRGRTHLQRFAQESGVEWDQSVQFELLGRATYSAERFTRFELLAVGERRGQTRYNAREDAPASPLGIALVLDLKAPRVAPANYWHYGWQ